MALIVAVNCFSWVATVAIQLPAAGGYMMVLFAAVGCGSIAVVDMYSRACWHSVACISRASGASCSLLSVAAGCSNILVMSLTDFAQAFGVITCMGEAVKRDCSGAVDAGSA